eukprot:CAMPEP_0171132178 /NCGR_PEP_ID=MMETSP0766_2-20121228/124064_1 /TAXON_ID=439317 /ORGANISM="Gambierdiscus australes, Strain CAWD 149" /LENGTH=79 /DNA_ID=CAMNT_0011595503 /DNA_START=39 /DNA_END=275 /DNA_ORIENTATION=-
MTFSSKMPVWRSPLFSLAGVWGWQLELHPQGHHLASAGLASLFLYLPPCARACSVVRFRMVLDGAAQDSEAVRPSSRCG